MDKRVLRERMRRKKRQMLMRRYMRLATYVLAAVLLVVFAVRGIILPIANRVSGGKADSEPTEIQAEVQPKADPNAAVRQPLKGQSDLQKLSSRVPGWHESEDGRWYQNADGTYYAGGFQEIDGVTYSFDENGYMQTGWVEKGVQDYYFNEDGSYDASKKKPMLALTYDDGPGEYTDRLLACLEENNAHATFFMLGQNVPSYPDTVKRMQEIGCEIGSHSYDHQNLYNLTLEQVAEEYQKTDEKLMEACGQAATVARAPYGNWSEDIINTVEKPFFMWSLDSRDWDYKDADLDYNAVINGDLTDGSIILMHDIHEASVEASLKLIPELIARGYKLVTVSELAAAKNVDLQLASYSDFWQSSLDNGSVAGYAGNGADASAENGSGDAGDGSEDGGDTSGDDTADTAEGDSDEASDEAA